MPWASKISIKFLMGGIVGLMGVTLLCLGVVGTFQAVSHELTSRRIVALSMAGRQLLLLIGDSRIERGDNLYALLGNEPLKPATQQTIHERRLKNIEHYELCLDLLGRVQVDELSEPLARLKQTYQQVETLRSEVDKAVLLPRSQRDAAWPTRWKDALEAYMGAIAKVTEVVDTAAELQDPRVDMLLTAKRAALAAQVHASMLSSVISSSIANGKPWGLAEVQQAANASGRVASDWDVLTRVATSPSAPVAFKLAFATANEEYFGKDTEFRLPIIEALSTGAPAGLTIDAWLKHSMGTTAILGAVPQAALADLVSITNVSATSALHSLIFSIAILAFAAVLLVCGLAIVRWRISLPMVRLAQVMRRLADRDYSVEVPGTQRGDELGAMAKTVLTFQQNGLAMQRLEAQSAEQNRLAEMAREQAAAEQAQVAAQQEAVVKALGLGLERLAEGDLTYQIETEFSVDYESLRKDFNAAVVGLQEAVGDICAHTATIRSGTHEIAAASDDLSRRTEQQAAGLEQTAAALQQITATVRRTASGSQEARTVAASAREDAQQSEQVVRDAVAAMAAIDGSARQISQIISVIDEIAFQTNLLALNAGVEAARAGDSGRGFAVVATEVRALAQRSADAAKEIKALIRTSEQQVGRGVALVGETGNALGRIITQVGSISRLIGEIAASAQEQSTGLAEVNTAVAEMEHVTQQNAAMVEKATAATHSLSHETEELSRATARFRLDEQTSPNGRKAA
jgi:methyl-accepting chemotaxis protein